MRTAILASAVAIAGITATATADSILSFGFTDLSGSFNSATMSYTAVGVDAPPLRTAGHVNRNQNPIGTAIYNPGTATGLVSVTLDISNVAGNGASGSGSMFIEDADGDRFVATITGSFIHQSPAIFFNGILSDIEFVPGTGSNNMFDGPSGGSFPLTFAPTQPPFSGATMLLSFDTPGGFFSQSYQGQSTQLNGAVIPSPGAIALLGMGGLLAARRRRSR